VFSCNSFLQEFSWPDLVFRFNISMKTLNSVYGRLQILAVSDNRDFVYSITQKNSGRVLEGSVKAKYVVRSLESAKVFH
jgi:hypothetical protein